MGNRNPDGEIGMGTNSRKLRAVLGGAAHLLTLQILLALEIPSKIDIGKTFFESFFA